MNQKDILGILARDEVSHYLDDLSKVHMLTKHYLLIAEELSMEGVAFLQPLKEHRDAYDHLNRIFFLASSDKKPEEFNYPNYIVDNLKKAFGHEYRAFFDMADWLTFICRKYIRETLSYKEKRKRYSERYDFEKTKEFINELPFLIAKYREDKDISKKRTPLIEEVLEYKDILERLINIYREVQSI